MLKLLTFLSILIANNSVLAQSDIDNGSKCNQVGGVNITLNCTNNYYNKPPTNEPPPENPSPDVQKIIPPRNEVQPKSNDSLEEQYERAKQGDADAQQRLGWRFANGIGVKKNETEAVVWYRKSSKQKNAEGERLLAWMLRNGLGVKLNIDEAVKLYCDSARQGNEDAKVQLQWMINNGQAKSCRF